MPMSNGNVAYDLSLYEKKSPERKPQENTQKHVKSSKAIRLKRIKHTSSLKMPRAFRALDLKRVAAVGLALSAVALFFTVSVSYQVRENELTSSIEKSEAELTTLKNDYDGLMVRYDTKMSDSAIEEYAKNELGMQKRENFQLEWITVGEQDEFADTNTKNSGLIDVIASYFE